MLWQREKCRRPWVDACGHTTSLTADCVHRVPSGTAATLINGAFAITTPGTDGAVSMMPPCVGTVDAPIRLQGAPASASIGAVRRLQNYDGWPTYAATNDSWGFDTMTAYMSVPNVPAAKPEVLYIFPVRRSPRTACVCMRVRASRHRQHADAPLAGPTRHRLDSRRRP